MTAEQADALRALVRSQSVGSLGTLHSEEPFVSMVPFALLPDGQGVIVHVSRLASHTKDMQADPRVSLMVMATQADSPQSRARVTIQGDSMSLPPDADTYVAARACYLARFPDAEHIFELGDFTLFRIAPVRLRVVGGFGQAFSSDAEDFASAMRSV